VRRVNIFHHTHGTTIRVEDHRTIVNGQSLLTRYPNLAIVFRGTRYHYLPTPASLTRLYRIVYHWPNQAAYVHTYQETTS